MKPFERLARSRCPIAQPNLDTDQIIPARYLQKPRADDFGRYLFRDLRYRKDGAENPGFLLNQPRVPRRSGSSSPSATSAADRRASTPCGRSAISASVR